MTDHDTIAAIGKQLGARYVVAGNIAKLGNRNLLIISIIQIDDLRPIAGDIQTYTQIEKIQDKLPGMARNIIAATWLASSGAEKLSMVPVELGANSDRPVADTLAQILSINTVRSGKYMGYPRTGTLAQVQAEHETQLSGVTADEGVIGIGKGDNPRFVLSVGARRRGWDRGRYGAVRLYPPYAVPERSQALAGIVDGVNLALVSGNQDRAAVRLSYTLKF